MLNFIPLHSPKPAPYSPSTAPMWDDPHISKGMLAAHLNPDNNRASRQLKFIQQSAKWIRMVTDLDETTSSILDLGCGPGLYCEEFAKAGHRVVGIDFSSRSIDHARNSARKAGLNIAYFHQNYLELNLQNRFDLATLIYCDFGVLNRADQLSLLQNIHRALKTNGYLVFDVFGEGYLDGFEEGKNWYFSDSGFWRPSPHLVLSQNYKYPEQKLSLEQYIVIDQQGQHCYRNWNKEFGLQEIGDLLWEGGFALKSTYGNLIGDPFGFRTNTMGVVAKARKL